MSQGSSGNIIAALVSFFIPGLGQLVQGRILAALACFVGTTLLWIVSLGLLGWVGHLVACLDAALWRGPQ